MARTPSQNHITRISLLHMKVHETQMKILIIK